VFQKELKNVFFDPDRTVPSDGHPETVKILKGQPRLLTLSVFKLKTLAENLALDIKNG
jgi:hypothetical protein